MPAAEQAHFRIEIEPGGRIRPVEGGAALLALCEEEGMRACVQAAIAAFGKAARGGQQRLGLACAPEDPRPLYLLLRLGRRSGEAAEIEGRALRPMAFDGPAASRLRELEAFTALWAHSEEAEPARAREAALAQLATLPEVQAVRLAAREDGSARSPQGGGTAKRSFVVEAAGEELGAGGAVQLRLGFPVEASGEPLALEILLEPDTAPDAWQLELFSGYADLFALLAARQRAAGERSDPPATAGVAAVPDELTHRQADIVYMLASGIEGTREIAAQLGIAAPTVKAHLRILMQRLGVSSRLELVRLAYERWGRWLEAERRRRGGSA
ncbi:Transcriptional regulatory protein UhpA [bacterium HR40]|nr:Transcriptional regulatory protein UhpA [bacterium HR40]